MVEQLTDFYKILYDLENIEVKLKDENKVLLLLNILPKMYENFKDVLLFRKEQTITIKEVQTSIKTKEFLKFQESKGYDSGLSPNVSKSKGKKKRKFKGKKSK